tara:strand:- start:130 stop:645 length:516 start_codon:yes stop_codon:yes gene_type:complete
MLFLRILIFVVPVLIIFPSYAKDDNNRLSLGVGQFNFMEDGTGPHNITSEVFNIEIHSGKKMFNLIKPFAGFMGTTENAYYAYGGFGIDGYYGKRKNWILTPAVACGYYKDGHEIKAGNPLEFYIGIDLFYRFTNNARLGFGIFHISNADSGYRNPGSETLILKYQIPLKK